MSTSITKILSSFPYFPVVCYYYCIVLWCRFSHTMVEKPPNVRKTLIRTERALCARPKTMPHCHLQCSKQGILARRPSALKPGNKHRMIEDWPSGGALVHAASPSPLRQTLTRALARRCFARWSVVALAYAATTHHLDALLFQILRHWLGRQSAKQSGVATCSYAATTSSLRCTLSNFWAQTRR